LFEANREKCPEKISKTHHRKFLIRLRKIIKKSGKTTEKRSFYYNV